MDHLLFSAEDPVAVVVVVVVRVAAAPDIDFFQCYLASRNRTKYLRLTYEESNQSDHRVDPQFFDQDRSEQRISGLENDSVLLPDVVVVVVDVCCYCC